MKNEPAPLRIWGDYNNGWTIWALRFGDRDIEDCADELALFDGMPVVVCDDGGDETDLMEVDGKLRLGVGPTKWVAVCDPATWRRALPH